MMKKITSNKSITKFALAAMLTGSLALSTNALAMEGSIQGMGSWWDAGDSG
jgi:hypothetical protein